MNESNPNQEGYTYQAVRIGDVDDWRLIATISAQGMGAWLRHVDPVRPLATLFSTEWNIPEEEILQKVEETVYDHPQVLDDFSADISITTSKAIWVPTEKVAEDEDEAYRLYTQVYAAEPNDLMSETVDDATCLFTMTPGLYPFLQRTFPGARIHSHQAVMVRRFRERSSDMPRIYVDIRPTCTNCGGGDEGEFCGLKGEVDFVVFDRKDLLLAATHNWHHPNDIRYHLFNIMSVCGLDPAKTQVSVSGPSRLKTELVKELRESIAFVMMTMVPSIGSKASLPLPASLLLRKQ